MEAKINYLILIISCFPLTVIARMGRKADTLCVYLLGGLFAWTASLNESNFDHQNYVNRINSIASLKPSGFLAQLEISKDPIFPIIVNLVDKLSSDYVFWTIAVISTASVILKVLATELLPMRRTLFLATYIIFLAPQFEFEAIRASLALSFVLFSLTRSRSVTRIFMWFLALLSHASILVIGLGILHQEKLSLRKCISLVFFVTILAYLALLMVPRVGAYSGNVGTLNAYFLPAISVASISLGYVVLSNSSLTDKYVILNFIYWAALISAIFATCISSFMVTVSFRVVAISWVLYIFFFFLKKGRLSNNRRFFYMKMTSLLLLLFAMSFASLKNDAWSILLVGWS